jgi:hypothetical protein
MLALVSTLSLTFYPMKPEFTFTSILNQPVNDTERPVTGEVIEFKSISTLKRLEEVRKLIASALIESDVA